MKYLKQGKVNLVLDGQIGSTGKGKIGGYICLHDKPEWAACVYSPNAGHTFVDDDGKAVLVKQIPQGVVNPSTRLIIGPDSAINLDVLKKEIEEHQLTNSRLFISDRALIITNEDIEWEKDNLARIASTFQGVGAAKARKVRRDSGVVLTRDIEWLKPFLCDTTALIHKRLAAGDTVFMEGHQGSGLDINHGIEYPYCLHGNTMVLMSDGSFIKIKDLDKHIGELVVSMDRDGNMVYRPITNWWSGDLGDKHWTKVVLETSHVDGKSMEPVSALVTNDHRIMTSVGPVPASELTNKHDVITGEYEITGPALQVFIGSILGDGTVPNCEKARNRHQFSITHTNRHVGYLTDKANIMSMCIGGSIRFGTYNESSFKPGNKWCRYDSLYSSAVNNLASKYGCIGKKRLNMTSLINDATELALAVWFQDDGSYKRKSKAQRDVYLFTNGFTHEEVGELCAAIKKKFGFVFHVENDSNGYPVMRLSRPHREAWFNAIGKYAHRDMLYKFPSRCVALNWRTLCNDVSKKFTTNKVVKVINNPKYTTRYSGLKNKRFDIEVADTHNFFIKNGNNVMCVHNCTSSMTCTSYFMAAIGVAPRDVGEVIGIVRPYPIRVGNVKMKDGSVGSSGSIFEDSKEVTWPEVMERCGGPKDHFELTSVTKRVRRVFEWSDVLYKRFIDTSGPTQIAINFAEYVDWDMLSKKSVSDLTDKMKSFIKRVEEVGQVKVRYIGTGAKNSEIITL